MGSTIQILWLILSVGLLGVAECEYVFVVSPAELSSGWLSICLFIYLFLNFSSFIGNLIVFTGYYVHAELGKYVFCPRFGNVTFCKDSYFIVVFNQTFNWRSGIAVSERSLQFVFSWDLEITWWCAHLCRCLAGRHVATSAAHGHLEHNVKCVFVKSLH